MKPNNLNVLRLMAAFLVLVGHSYIFLGMKEPLFLSWLHLGPLGVYVFFIISGYLITQSWDRDPSLYRFLVKRNLRIFPGLAVCIFLMVFFLGPLVTVHPIPDFFNKATTWRFFSNVILYPVYYLPGVFENSLVPNAVNGSLWSLPVEFFMYFMVAIIGALGLKKLSVTGLVLIFACLTYFWAWNDQDMLVVYGTDLRQICICGTYFWVGATIWKYNLTRYFTLSTALLAVFAMITLEAWPKYLHVMSWFLLPIVVLSFGLSHSPVLEKIIRGRDYSYGIYIYAFPVQQTVVYFYPKISLGLYVFLCSIITLILAAFSWHLVENKALAWKPTKPVSK
ncbi:MAG: acyltransferase [Gammaproteobacteria bacterium]|nr:acyltransferase [Gammaproteobacteria bacterium]